MYLGKNIIKNTNKNLLFMVNIGQIHYRIKINKGRNIWQAA